MARQLSVNIPEKYTQEIISNIRDKEGLLSLSIQKNASIKPAGDILMMQITNSKLIEFIHILEKYNLGKKGGISLSTSEPDSIITNEHDYRIEQDGHEAIWEEVEMVISKDSNMTPNILIMMAMAGAITTTGLATSTIHIVIGGMLVAPGFMPIMRITLGLANKNNYWYIGITDTLKGYLSLMIGAVLATLLLRWAGIDPLSPLQEYYQLHNTLIDYWTTVNFSTIITSAAGTIVGILMLITKRTIFTSGVMIALALIPAASLIAISLISGEFELAGKAGFRLAVDFIIILGISFIFFSAKQYWVHKRTIKL